MSTAPSVTFVPSRLADGSMELVRIGTRVELSPACDLWMQGAKYGRIERIDLDEHGREIVTVRMDHPAVKRLQRFFPAYLMRVAS